MNLQYQDQNIGPASYKHLKEDELLITKIFYTIQGEGPFAGYPAVFVRLAGCNRGEKQNMGCEFCDTDFRFANGMVKSFAQIIKQMEFALLDKICVYDDQIRPLVVITGGEPMMQDNLHLFIEQLFQYGWKDIQIESNGDRLGEGFGYVLIEDGPSIAETIYLVVSPKAGKDGYKKLNDAVWKAADALKFIVSADETSQYHNVPDWAFEFQKTNRPVYFQPMTVYKKFYKVTDDPELQSYWMHHGMINQEGTRDNFKRAADLAMRYGFRLSTQLHLLYEVE